MKFCKYSRFIPNYHHQCFSCEVRRDIEAMPDMFRLTGVERVYFEAVQSAAAFVGADPSNLVICNNLTTALNAVINSLRLKI